jgi:kynurenine 3-monooxygenase
VGCSDAVLAIAIPAYGRLIHGTSGELTYQPYGAKGEALYSITRNELNRTLLDFAEKTYGVELRFRHKCQAIDFHEPRATFECLESGEIRSETASVIFGSDGAFSAVRWHMQKTDRFNFSQEYIRQGYKELTVPFEFAERWRLERNALHLWPRGHYMLIGFANSDGSATLALHLPFEGEPSFASIRTESDLLQLFAGQFPDTLERIPNLVHDYFTRPISSMLTIRCFPWVRGRVALIGDAAHAIVPSYGQGANSGFEDCTTLDTCLEQHGGDWDMALAAYQSLRKPNADVIADLSLQHFNEIRDHVGNPDFLLRKDIERRLDELYPGRFPSLYSMVSFTSMTYQESIALAREHEELVDRILQIHEIRERLKEGTVDALLSDFVQNSQIGSPSASAEVPRSSGSPVCTNPGNS